MGCTDNVIDKLPQVDVCCCGCELSTGAELVGWLQLVLGAVLEFVGVAGIVSLNRSRSQIKPGPNQDAEMTAVTAGIAVLVFIMIITLFGLILGVILLMGIKKKDSKKVKLWLRVQIIFFIVGLVFVGLGFLGLVFENPAKAFGQLFGAAVNYAITFYLIVVVKSYYATQEVVFLRAVQTP